MATVPIHEAETDLSQLIERAMQGEEILIGNQSEQRVRLVPVDPDRKPDRVPGALAGQISIPDSFFEPMSEEELRLWEGG